MTEAGEEFGGSQMLQAFEALEDPRSRSTYALQELLLAALSAVTSGADDWNVAYRVSASWYVGI